MMRNTYLTSHFPLFSILLFSISFAIYTELQLTEWLMNVGLYQGMLEFFSETGIKFTLLFFLVLFFFMIFSALKLIVDTVMELSLLFFSQDVEGNELRKVRGGTWIYLIASVCSLFFVTVPIGIVSCFLAATIIYFIFFVYKVGESMSGAGLFGMIFFHVSFWSVSTVAILYAAFRLYNSLIKSLPL
ncbi:hypothetical protein J2S78_002333 [Salibacterium salarium]|uniref:DUF5366 family protein n=1 Tax=Salibacterium salarium TaxID=284579 RepID=UPI00277DD1EC|nr:DUF5366 family protein [Salibacterium salarium]MDQ0299913.1 hypothetical protein [Salibacterium salarium]